MPGEHIRLLVDGAAYLFSNDYEKGLLEQKTVWSDEEILDRVGVRVTTLGPKGVVIDRKGEPSLHVPPAPELGKADPTGVGDAFRAGFLAALGWGLPLERCGQAGNLTATHVLECVGMLGAYETALGVVRPGGAISRVGVPQYTDGPVGRVLFGRNVTLTGGVAPARAYIEELLPDVLSGAVQPGRVFDRTMPLAEIPEAYRAMNDREALKVLIKP